MTRIDQFGMETVDAVTVLIKANRYLQALVVLYAAIDTFAWSTRAAGDVTRSDFVAWVTNYMKPTRLGCTADDLYAARCALLHSGATESRMSREGKASELWYATAPKSVPTLEKLIRERGVDAKVIYVTDLLATFADGAMKFADELTAQEARRLVVTQRINRWLSFVPSAVTAALAGHKRGSPTQSIHGTRKDEIRCIPLLWIGKSTSPLSATHRNRQRG